MDESGDHNLSTIDPQYPIFVLGGVIVDEDYAQGDLSRELNEFKQEFFGTTELILHTADIVRNRNGFEQLANKDFRDQFYSCLNYLMRNLAFQAIACVIQKDRHSARYGEAAINPYLLSLTILVERFCFEIGNQKNAGRIVAERRDPTLDKSLEIAWLDLRNRGTRFLRPNTIDERITSLDVHAKNENIAGLQLADLVVSPIGRHVMGKPDHEDWEIVYEKLRRDRLGNVNGYGLVVLPK